MSVLLHNVENLTERNRDDLGSLKGYRTVPPQLPGSAKLPHNGACLADVIDELVAALRDASDLHEPLLDEEERLIFVSDIVDHLVFFEGRHATVPQDDITKLSPKHRRQCRRKRPVTCSRIAGGVQELARIRHLIANAKTHR